MEFLQKATANKFNGKKICATKNQNINCAFENVIEIDADSRCGSDAFLFIIFRDVLNNIFLTTDCGVSSLMHSNSTAFECLIANINNIYLYISMH